VFKMTSGNFLPLLRGVIVLSLSADIASSSRQMPGTVKFGRRGRKNRGAS
jgi:hypothetical protein